MNVSSVVYTNGALNRRLAVTVQSRDGVLTQSPSIPVTSIALPAVQGGGAGATRLDELLDVVEGASPPDGGTLVYNTSIDKYEVQILNLDGGTF